MKIRVKNGSLAFEESDYATVVLGDSNVETNSAYVRWSDGGINDYNGSGIFPLFPYKGGDITLKHMVTQWYNKAVICFYTDEGETYVRFANGEGTQSNGLGGYITATYGKDDYDYFIPEKDILALGDIKYFRIGCVNWALFDIATVRYKIRNDIEK